MSFRGVFKGASFLSLSEIIGQACSLIRTIVLARFLAKADFGVAAMLGMILTIFEMSGKMALGQQIVQSKYSREEGFINSLHFNQITLSTTSAILIFASAWPIAHFFVGSQYIVTIMILAVVPLLGGFTNLDVYRQTKDLKFGAQVLSEVLPQIAITLAVWPLAMIFHDYRAVLWLLITKSALYIIMTHLLAHQSFRPRFDARRLKESLKFGWPLLVSGFVQFGNFQGDSAIIAAKYSLEQLGEFSAALTIAMAPGLIIMKVSSAISLPLLAHVQDDDVELSIKYQRYVEIMAFLSCCMMLGMFFCGEQMVVLLFGAKYANIGGLASFLTAVQALRVIRNVIGDTAMARGDTMNNLVSSSWRLSGLTVAILVSLTHGSLIWFAVAGIVGETVALSAVISRLARRHRITPIYTISPTILGLVIVLVAVALRWTLSIGPYSLMNWIVMPGMLIFGGFFYLLFFREFRSLVLGLITKTPLKMHLQA
jgi:O-antigen/teichoic acid export membrane protein